MEATDADLNDEDEVDNKQLCFGLHTSQRGSASGMFIVYLSGCTDNSDLSVCPAPVHILVLSPSHFNFRFESGGVSLSRNLRILNPLDTIQSRAVTPQLRSWEKLKMSAADKEVHIYWDETR